MKRPVFLVLMLTSYLAFAQNPDQERLNAYKIGYITKRLNLTPAEAERFWPVYNALQDDKLKIQQERMQLNRRFNDEGSGMTDEQLITLGDKLMELELNEAELSVKYHNTLKGVLPPYKILRLYQAEHQYRQMLLNELQDRKEQRDNPGQPAPPKRND